MGVVPPTGPAGRLMAGATGSRAFSTPGVALDAPGASWAPSMYLGGSDALATMIFPQSTYLFLTFLGGLCGWGGLPCLGGVL